MKYTLATLLIRGLSLLPLPLLHWLAVPLGRLCRWLPWRGHGVIETNLRLCFPELEEKKRRRLHRQHLVEMMRLVLESGAVWYWPRRRLDRHVQQVDGWGAVEAAIEQGRGVLLVGAHFGNWEIAQLWISMRIPLIALYRAPRDAEINRRITVSRGRFGASLIASGSPAMRRILTALRAGRAVAMLADQQPKQGDGTFTPFFGVEALTMTLVNRLARHTGCAVFFGGFRRLAGGRGWAMFLERAPAMIADDDPATAMRAYHGCLEAQIRKAPAQYLWNYKRFSLRPDNEPGIY